jgi:hypothetical protein
MRDHKVLPHAKSKHYTSKPEHPDILCNANQAQPYTNQYAATTGIERPLPFWIRRLIFGDARLAINNPIDNTPATDPMLQPLSDAIASARMAER